MRGRGPGESGRELPTKVLMELSRKVLMELAREVLTAVEVTSQGADEQEDGKEAGVHRTVVIWLG